MLPFPAALLAQTADTAEKKDDTLKLQTFEVTGSRAKRMDTEGPAPVVSLSRGDLDLSGCITAGDFVRNFPMNTGGNIDPARTPVGQRLFTGQKPVAREIVGVVGDTRSTGLATPSRDEIYLPLAQVTWPAVGVVARRAWIRWWRCGRSETRRRVARQRLSASVRAASSIVSRPAA